MPTPKDLPDIRHKYMTEEDAARLVETEEEVMALRIKGVSFYRIERQLGITNANRVFQRAIERRPNMQYKREEAIRLEGERLDALQEGVWSRAISGDVKAVEACIKLLERRARLYGLDFGDLMNAQLVQIEQAKMDLMSDAFAFALSGAGLSQDQSDRVTQLFFDKLRSESLPEIAGSEHSPEPLQGQGNPHRAPGRGTP